MNKIREFRAEVSETIEPLRKDGVIRSSLEASVTAPVDAKLVAALTALGISRKDIYEAPKDPADNLSDYLIISECDLSQKASGISITALSSENAFTKCERSWKYFKAGAGETITPRDAAAVQDWDNANG